MIQQADVSVPVMIDDRLFPFIRPERSPNDLLQPAAEFDRRGKEEAVHSRAIESPTNDQAGNKLGCCKNVMMLSALGIDFQPSQGW